MTTLIYKFTDCLTESGKKAPVLSDIIRADGEDILFLFENLDKGELRISSERKSLNLGRCKIKKSELGNGLYYPKLITDTRVYALEPIEISDSGVYTGELISDGLLALRGAHVSLAGTVASLTQRVLCLEEKIGNGHTFKL